MMMNPIDESKPRGERGYDAYADAVQRGITVGFLELESVSVLWVPEVNAVLVNAALSERARHDALAHGIGHAQVERSLLGRRVRLGQAPLAAVEAAVHKHVATASISFPDLARAAASSDDSIDIAERLGVSTAMLLWRLHDLNWCEGLDLDPALIDRIQWTTDHPVATLRCTTVTPGALDQLSVPTPDEIDHLCMQLIKDTTNE